MFSAPFPPRALSSPSELSVVFPIILAGIKYNCVWKVQKSKLPLGIFSPVSPVELKTGVSLNRYVFQAAGVLICKAHYSNKTLKRDFLTLVLSACFHSSTNSTSDRFPVKLQSPKSRFINWYSDFNVCTFIMSLRCEFGHSFSSFLQAAPSNAWS